jgi:subtilisin family serine protease
MGTDLFSHNGRVIEKINLSLFSLAWLSALALLSLSPLLAARPDQPSFKPHHEAEIVPGEVLIKYRAAPVPIEAGQGGRTDLLAARQQVFVAEATRISRELPVTLIATYPTVGVQRMQITGGESVQAIMVKLDADAAVELVEPNYKVYPFQEKSARERQAAQPNDLTWPVLWGLKQIQGPAAWTRTTGSDQVIVAVMDSGLDYTHRDLAANTWRNPQEEPNGKDDDGNGIVDDLHGISLCKGEPAGDPQDDLGHGTHVAGTIAAVGDNGHDVAGVAWRAKVMGVKFLCRDGSGTTADAIRGIEYALAKGAHIINMSWGGPGRSRALEETIKEAERQGVLIVAAAGNEGLEMDRYPQYPAGFQEANVLAIAATDSSDRLAPFSNWGKQSVHLAAPGVSILSTVPGNKLTFYNGTSMAAPYAAGCAALLKAQNASLGGAELKQALLTAGDPVEGLEGRVSSGRRLNCGKAVGRLEAR